MAEFGLTDKRMTNPNVRKLLTPLALSIILILALASLAFFAKSQLTQQLAKLTEAKKIENSLTQKLAVLEEIDKGILSLTDVSLVAIPDKNPGLLMISQLKGQAAKSNLQVGENEISAGVKLEGLDTADLISHEDGELLTTIEFLKQIKTLSPVTSIENVILERSIEGNTYSSENTISVYWASLPTKIPAVDEPVIDLTAEEKRLLGEISNLSRPEFTTLPPSSPGTREDPFN